MGRILALLSACGTYVIDVILLAALAVIWVPFGILLLALHLPSKFRRT